MQVLFKFSRKIRSQAEIVNSDLEQKFQEHHLKQEHFFDMCFEHPINL